VRYLDAPLIERHGADWECLFEVRRYQEYIILFFKTTTVRYVAFSGVSREASEKPKNPEFLVGLFIVNQTQVSSIYC
jgi:hypothetical protein